MRIEALGDAAERKQWYRPAKDLPPAEMAQECWEIFYRGLVPAQRSR